MNISVTKDKVGHFTAKSPDDLINSMNERTAKDGKTSLSFADVECVNAGHRLWCFYDGEKYKTKKGWDLAAKKEKEKQAKPSAEEKPKPSAQQAEQTIRR